MIDKHVLGGLPWVGWETVTFKEVGECQGADQPAVTTSPHPLCSSTLVT